MDLAPVAALAKALVQAVKAGGTVQFMGKAGAVPVTFNTPSDVLCVAVGAAAVAVYAQCGDFIGKSYQYGSRLPTLSD